MSFHRRFPSISMKLRFDVAERRDRNTRLVRGVAFHNSFWHKDISTQTCSPILSIGDLCVNNRMCRWIIYWQWFSFHHYSFNESGIKTAEPVDIYGKALGLVIKGVLKSGLTRMKKEHTDSLPHPSSSGCCGLVFVPDTVENTQFILLVRTYQPKLAFPFLVCDSFTKFAQRRDKFYIHINSELGRITNAKTKAKATKPHNEIKSLHFGQQ